MPKTVKAKFLLGWMSRKEALDSLNSCIFDNHLTERKAIALWKDYRARVLALEPRVQTLPQNLALNPAEETSVTNHIQKLNTTKPQFCPRVIKLHPAELLAKQFHVLTERSEEYAQGMHDERTRINTCLGVGMEFNGQLVFRQVGTNRILVDLPHPEYIITATQNGTNLNFHFQERDRYILVVPCPAANRLVLWGGYHRTHALLCHMGGDAAAVAPLLTVMTGIPEVDNFFARPSFERDVLLGERPALMRDFLDENLFMTVNLRKRRARGWIEQVRPGKFRSGIQLVNDDS